MSTLEVMTWNVRNGNPDPGHDWADRAPMLASVLAEVDPDVLCVQEALPGQLSDLRGMLPDHDVVGRGRDADPGSGEFTALFVRRSRVEVADSGFFWLSDTPDVSASISWGHSLPRLCVWARCVDRSSRHPFTLAGAHVTHLHGPVGDRARRLGAALIGDRLAGLPGPALLMGDFNEAIARGSFEEFSSRGFRDLWSESSSDGGSRGESGGRSGGKSLADSDPDSHADSHADDLAVAHPDSLRGSHGNSPGDSRGRSRGDSVGTHHGYAEPDPHGDRIDWILGRGEVLVRDIRILDNSLTRTASDHFPILAHLTLPA